MPMRVPNWISAAASSALMMRDARLEFKTRELAEVEVGIKTNFLLLEDPKLYTPRDAGVGDELPADQRRRRSHPLHILVLIYAHHQPAPHAHDRQHRDQLINPHIH